MKFSERNFTEYLAEQALIICGVFFQFCIDERIGIDR